MMATFLKSSFSYWECKGRYQDTYNDLADKLIPAVGYAGTEFGEILRVLTNIYHMYYKEGYNKFEQIPLTCSIKPGFEIPFDIPPRVRYFIVTFMNNRAGCKSLTTDDDSDDFALFVQDTYDYDANMLEKAMDECILYAHNKYNQYIRRTVTTCMDGWWDGWCSVYVHPEQPPMKRARYNSC